MQIVKIYKSEDFLINLVLLGYVSYMTRTKPV